MKRLGVNKWHQVVLLEEGEEVVPNKRVRPAFIYAGIGLMVLMFVFALV